MTLAQLAPDTVLLAVLGALTRLCHRQGHHTPGKPAHRHTRPRRHNQTTTEGDSA